MADSHTELAWAAEEALASLQSYRESVQERGEVVGDAHGCVVAAAGILESALAEYAPDKPRETQTRPAFPPNRTLFRYEGVPVPPFRGEVVHEPAPTVWVVDDEREREVTGGRRDCRAEELFRLNDASVRLVTMLTDAEGSVEVAVQDAFEAVSRAIDAALDARGVEDDETRGEVHMGNLHALDGVKRETYDAG